MYTEICIRTYIYMHACILLHLGSITDYIYSSWLARHDLVEENRMPAAIYEYMNICIHTYTYICIYACTHSTAYSSYALLITYTYLGWRGTIS